MSDFMALCSDVETDDGKTEKKSPWPKFMQDEVWADRVKFRRIMKKEITKYKKTLEAHGQDFVQWWLDADEKTRKSCFMMPKEELKVQFNTVFEFKTAYQVVLCSVLEQVEKFEATGYKLDGATDCENYFEESLRVYRGAWVVTEDYYTTLEGCDNFFGMLLQLGGDHLLPKRPRDKRAVAARAKVLAEGPTDDNSEDEEEEEENNDKDNASSSAQSFRGDRRLVRLMIFRYYADQAWKKFERAMREKAKDGEEEVAEAVDSENVNEKAPENKDEEKEN
eukprot:CAMPEP_0204838398 /NCGR_PEP_ID=MMETSP1346-20131115/30815_1 /ASSEMBLY_ACC=CAM_ASM_000771 /TAXON_ID=215587 /ORGANISM="Aplanochytrium stocchinoi, Strain GSBS06" /LENGTH=278 /DNA_ID=CAMNT_0051974427 /DNA_START=238 /DNA_END=1078 /DNA_ORIENTATION=-